MKIVLEKGYGALLGDGSACLSVGHVDDLARLFVVLAERIIDDGGKDVPRGKEGVMFASVGVVTAAEIFDGCLDVAFRNGALPRPGASTEKEVRKVELSEVAAFYGGGDMGDLLASVIWSGHMQTTSTIGPRLGWSPIHKLSDFSKEYDNELQVALKGGI